jgi:hypothetical protein
MDVRYQCAYRDRSKDSFDESLVRGAFGAIAAVGGGHTSGGFGRRLAGSSLYLNVRYWCVADVQMSARERGRTAGDGTECVKTDASIEGFRNRLARTGYNGFGAYR